MKAHVEIGGGQTMALKGAVLIYSGVSRAFCTWHEARRGSSGEAVLGEATALTTEFVRSLAGELSPWRGLEILPSNVLARAEESIVWWSPAVIRPMFFRTGDTEAAEFTGERFPHPPLVWRVQGRRLAVRALAENKRPEASTQLRVAPYFNTDGQNGDVCQGSMRSPEETGVAAIGQWESAFFQSEFTHQTGARKLTSHPRGFYGLWRSMCGQARFPMKNLVPANETLLEFARREDR